MAGFHWSKDGQHIAFTAARPETKAGTDRKEKYSDYEVFENDFTQNQLWLVDVAASEKSQTPVKATTLTSDDKLNVGDFCWSLDSSRIAFSATPNPLLAFGEQSDLYLVDLGPANTHTMHKIVALDGPETNPAFSPDGKQIAFQTALARPYDYYLNDHIATVKVDAVLERPATATADVTDLTSKFDEDPQLIDWGPDGIYFQALQKPPRTCSALIQLVTPSAASRHRTTILWKPSRLRGRTVTSQAAWNAATLRKIPHQSQSGENVAR